VIWKSQANLLSPPTGISFSVDGSRVALTDSFAVALVKASDGTPILNKRFADRLSILRSPEYRFGREAEEPVAREKAVPHRAVRISNWLGCAALSADGDVFAQGVINPSYGNVAVEIKLLRESGNRWRIPFGSRFNALDLSPDGKLLALGGEDRGIRIISTSSGKELAVLRGHGREVWGVAFNSDGRLLTSTDRFGTARIWDVGGMLGLAPAAQDGRQPPAAPKYRDEQGDRNPINFIGHLPDGAVIGRVDGSIEVWNEGTRKGVICRSVKATVRNVALDPSRERLVMSDSSGALSLWHIASGRELMSFATTLNIYSLLFSPDGQRLFVLGQARGSEGVQVRLQILDVSTGLSVAECQVPGKVPGAFARNKDGTMLACSDDRGVITLHEANQGRILHTLRGHTDGIRSLAFSPAGDRLVSGSSDKSVRIWDVRSGNETMALTRLFDSVPYATFDPEGQWLLVRQREGLRRYPIGSGQSSQTATVATDPPSDTQLKR
jgi:WD40 repeat protein